MKLTLTPGQSSIFGYGSLLSVRSLGWTLGRSYDGPFLPCTVTGWRRTWDAAVPNKTPVGTPGQEKPNKVYFVDTPGGPMYPERILYLNVSPDPAVHLNGVLFVVNTADLAKVDQREWIYRRVELTKEINIEVENGNAYMYVCESDSPYCWRNVESPRKGAIRATYIKTVETGLSAFGSNFRKQYLASTDDPPTNLVVRDHS